MEVKEKIKEKLFVVRKYIMASSAQEAIKKDKTHPVEEVWVDEDFKKKSLTELTSQIGFEVDNETNE